MNKTCTICNKTKPISEFRKRGVKYGGYSAECLSCSRIRVSKFKKTKYGVIRTIYDSQKQSSKRRGHPMPNYTFNEFYLFAIVSDEFNELYNKWVDSNYDSWHKPTFDRYDDNLGYSFENFNCWMTYKDNNNKWHESVLSGEKTNYTRQVVAVNIKNGSVYHFYSTMDAQRKTGLSHSGITACCKGKMKTSGGMVWFYLEDYDKQKQ